MRRSNDADVRALLVVIEPRPGGLARFRARRARGSAWPWWLGGMAATTAALLLALRVTPPPRAAQPPVDLVAGLDAATLHPRWIGLGRVAPPAEPLTLTGELAGVVAARRVATEDEAVVFYMLESK